MDTYNNLSPVTDETRDPVVFLTEECFGSGIELSPERIEELQQEVNDAITFIESWRKEIDVTTESGPSERSEVVNVLGQHYPAAASIIQRRPDFELLPEAVNLSIDQNPRVMEHRNVMLEGRQHRSGKSTIFNSAKMLLLMIRPVLELAKSGNLEAVDRFNQDDQSAA